MSALPFRIQDGYGIHAKHHGDEGASLPLSRSTMITLATAAAKVISILYIMLSFHITLQKIVASRMF